MDSQTTEARLTVRRGDGLLQVGLAGDWIAHAGLPGISPVEEQLAMGSGPVQAMVFETRELGRWNSGLMTFVLKCYALCQPIRSSSAPIHCRPR